MLNHWFHFQFSHLPYLPWKTPPTFLCLAAQDKGGKLMRTQPEEAPVIFMINHYHYLKNNFFSCRRGDFYLLIYLQYITFLCFGQRRIQHIPVLFFIQPSSQIFVLWSKEKAIHSKKCCTSFERETNTFQAPIPVWPSAVTGGSNDVPRRFSGFL